MSEKNKLFLEADSDQSGYIEFEEFMGIIKNKFNIEETERNIVEDIFLFADGNGFFNSRDNRLNKSEFAKIEKAFPSQYSTPQEALLFLLFNMVDVNKNGCIEKKEFETFYKRVSRTGTSSDEINKAFNHLQKDENGKITKDVFIQWILKQ